MNPSLISVHLSVRQRKEDRITATPLVFHSCSTRVLDGNQTDGAPLSRAEVDVPWIMPVIFSHLGCFVMSDTLLNDTTNIYLQDDKICLHCLKVLFQTFIQYLTMGIASGMTNPESTNYTTSVDWQPTTVMRESHLPNIYHCITVHTLFSFSSRLKSFWKLSSADPRWVVAKLFNDEQIFRYVTEHGCFWLGKYSLLKWICSFCCIL